MDHGGRLGSPDCYWYGQGMLHCIRTAIETRLTLWLGNLVKGVYWECLNASEYLRRIFFFGSRGYTEYLRYAYKRSQLRLETNFFPPTVLMLKHLVLSLSLNQIKSNHIE